MKSTNNIIRIDMRISEQLIAGDLQTLEDMMVINMTIMIVKDTIIMIDTIIMRVINIIIMMVLDTIITMIVDTIIGIDVAIKLNAITIPNMRNGKIDGKIFRMDEMSGAMINEKLFRMDELFRAK